MVQRPRSVSVISWFLIITGAISLITSTIGLGSPEAERIMAKSPIPLNVQYLMLYAGLLISMVCGVAMLKGRNWARFLYVGWSGIGFLIALATAQMKPFMVPGIIIFLIIAFFLFRPKANEYFRATAPAGHGS